MKVQKKKKPYLQNQLVIKVTWQPISTLVLFLWTVQKTLVFFTFHCCVLCFFHPLIHSIVINVVYPYSEYWLNSFQLQDAIEKLLIWEIKSVWWASFGTWSAPSEALTDVVPVGKCVFHLNLVFLIVFSTHVSHARGEECLWAIICLRFNE